MIIIMNECSIIQWINDYIRTSASEENNKHNWFVLLKESFEMVDFLNF
jgi:hypothetical protein